MITKTILLNSIAKVKNFVNAISKYEGKADLLSGNYLINAKSIMGIFSLDLVNPLTLNIYVEEGEEFNIDLSEFEINPTPEPEPEPEPDPEEPGE